MPRRYPYHLDIPRWAKLHGYGQYLDYGHWLGSSEEEITRQVEAGIVRRRLPEEPRTWYPVVPMPAWEKHFIWDRDADILMYRPKAIMELRYASDEYAARSIAEGHFTEVSYWNNAQGRADSWYTWNDPYMYGTDLLRMQAMGYVRAAELLVGKGKPQQDLWALGFVRNKLKRSRRSRDGISLEVHPFARPHLVLWERWQDVLVRPGQDSRFRQLLDKVLTGRTALLPWPEEA
ncbi:MAG: hypothetical protein KBF80_02915 [Flavobacteriales bacterium]|nr:hypothetical protein [Flavobacteriales bacterium]